ELSYLVAHSMYHLLGYDHITDELKKDMREKEENALKGIL
ncbi:MAG: rRNA maturation RNase YbeY, partial [Lachnospiraceae bacterium]|nr:rRNA maturation RNase YbeY [Lachnospiraceae bacterium]